MRERYPSQLIHFHGIQNFGPDTESLDGTIFLFSLRGSSRSLSRPITLAEPEEILEGYMGDAEAALLFARHVASIRYTVRLAHDDDTAIKVVWEVSRQTVYTERIDDLSVVETMAIVNAREDRSLKHKTFWQVIKRAGEDEEDASWFGDAHLDGGLKGHDHRIAAPVRSDGAFQEVPFIGKVLNSQFCGSESEVPVHIYLSLPHTFGTNPGPPLEDAEARESVLPLYIKLVAHLAAQFGGIAYNFWPQISTEHVFAHDFWREVPQSEAKVFISLETAVSARVGFPLALSYSQAVFDTTPDSISASLRMLFVNLNIRSVARPPIWITAALRRVVREDHMRLVSPAFVRSLLGLADIDVALLGVWTAENFSCQALSSILDFAFGQGKDGENNDDDEDIRDLDGCVCLPLMNRALGKLRLMSRCRDGTTCQTEAGDGGYVPYGYWAANFDV